MADRSAGALEQSREQQLAAQGTDRAGLGEIERALDQHLVGIDFGERLDARQQQRPPGGLAQQRFGEQPARAPGR